MSIIVYLHIFLLYVDKFSANNTDTFLEHGPDEQMESLRNLCPYNKFCGSFPLKKIQRQDHEPCCQECSCENDCFETGSCCPDMPLSGHSDPKFPCKHLWDFGKFVENKYFTDDSAYYYHIIDNCPEKVENLSYQKCYQPTDVQDYVIVYDNTTGKLYKNKHCANCHGIQKYTNLKLRIDCEDYLYKHLLSLETAVEGYRYVLQNCSLMSLPPDRHISMSHCLPKNLLISACNSSGDWDIYNREVEKGCKAHETDRNMIYRRPPAKSDKHLKFYANVFCFLCNVPTETEKADSCKILQLKDNEKSGLVSLYAILDITMFGKNNVMTEESLCHSTEIWDPFSNLCRQLFCPAGHIPDHGSCKGLLSNIYGYSFAIHYKVNIKNGTIAIDSFLLNILENRLTRELGKDITCGICRVILLSKESTSPQLFFRQELFSTEGCPYDMLQKRVRKLAIKKEFDLQFRLRGQVFNIMLSLIFEEIDFMTGYNELFVSVSSFCGFVTPIDASILLFCPTIEISEEEVGTLGINNFYDNSVSFSLKKNESDPMFQRVCVDSYFLAKEINLTSTAVISFSIYKILGILLTSLSLQHVIALTSSTLFTF